MTRAPQNARAVLDRNMDEDALLTAIVEAALFLGWRVHHDRRSDKALQQGSPGFPDLVLARGGRVLFWELKSERGGLTTDQLSWNQALRQEHGAFVEVSTVRPSDLDAALAELSRG